MLISQAAINLTANILSAVLGLGSVFVFTRLFAPRDYGAYLLGIGFASVVSVFLVGWFRNLIISEHARDDGEDVRGLVLQGFLLVCLTAPLSIVLGIALGLNVAVAAASVALAMAIGLFEMTQDFLRARLQAGHALKSTVIRAAAMLVIGVMLAMIDADGTALLIAATLACLLAVGMQLRLVWKNTAFLSVDKARLIKVAKLGLPLTVSLTLLAISSVIDRFMIANLVGTGDAGKYVSGLDLVRQSLMMPAFSLAAAFVPIAVQIYAKHGREAVRHHLRDCVELLLAVSLPACLGFAVIASHIANIVLGTDFRDLAAAVMPIIAIAVLFQILTQQYLHASFLLAGRNSFYLINTAAIIVANLIMAYLFVSWYGAIGAAWARLGADIVGVLSAWLLTRRSFAMPFPAARLARVTAASLVMALLVAAIDRHLRVSDVMACVILIPVGLLSYAALCWTFDIAHARYRLHRGWTLLRGRLARGGSAALRKM